jgi:carbamoyl-phosphate synthase large subunit
MNPELLAKAKSFGFSDRQIAVISPARPRTPSAPNASAPGLVPSYRFGRHLRRRVRSLHPVLLLDLRPRDDEIRPTDRRKVMILGGGPNRIGQGIEFDYCCVHAAFALKEEGFETLMVNSNPKPSRPTTTPATSCSSSR